MKTSSETLFQRYKLHLAAGAGAVAGMVLASVVFLVAMGTGQGLEFSVSSSKPSSVTTGAEGALQKKVEELTGILEAINRWGSDTHGVTVAETADVSQCEDCLKKCRMDFPGTDGQSRTLLFDCTKGCLLQYSSAMKEMRDRFYRPASKR